MTLKLFTCLKKKNVIADYLFRTPTPILNSYIEKLFLDLYIQSTNVDIKLPKNNKMHDIIEYLITQQILLILIKLHYFNFVWKVLPYILMVYIYSVRFLCYACQITKPRFVQIK